MELHICHLYPELLNAYGDVGNLKVLTYRAKERGIMVYVHDHSVGDVLDKNECDIILCGGGQDFEMQIVLRDLEGEKKEFLREYIEDGGVMLSVCSGYEMLGTSYITAAGDKAKGLGILPVHTEKGEKRVIGNIAVSMEGVPVVGFENHVGKMYIGDLQPLGHVLTGFGNNGEDTTEGLLYKGTYCTYLHGPLLAKNPELADKILEAALTKKYGECTLSPLDDTLEIAARNAILARMGIMV